MRELPLNRNRIVSAFVGILCLLIISISFAGPVYAQDTLDTVEPPRLRALEYTAVQIVYFAWAFGGIFFAVVLSYIGFIYMTSAGDPQKQEEAKGRAKSWMIGLLLFFLAYPIISFAYDIVGVGEGSPECYDELNSPGFHFFFPDTCTNPFEEDVAFRHGLDCPGEPSTVPAGKCCHNGIIFPANQYIEYNSTTDIRRFTRQFVEENGEQKDTGLCLQTQQYTCSTGEPCTVMAPYIYNASGEGADRIRRR